MKIFNLPDLGEGLPDAEIREWYVKEGDEVKVDQPMVAMETAKAVVDVPSPYSGKIVKLYGQVGDIIQTGNPLVEYADAGTTTAETKSTDAGTVAGAIEVGNKIIEESATGITPTQTISSQIKAIPAVRMLAKQLGVALEALTPTGPQGQITVDDVKKAAQIGAVATPKTSVSSTMGGTTDAIRGTRRAMANIMAQSHAEVVPVTIVDDADIHAWSANTDITWRVIRALVTACKMEPALNIHFDMKKLERMLFTEINIGIAMDSKDGLFVPVLKNAEKLDQADVRKTIERFKTEVSQRSISPEDLKGSTIQLSNFGTFAGKYASPIIVPPIVAIVGTGKIREQVVVMDGTIVIHRILPLSLTIDHRAVTGGEAARFLKAMIVDLELKE